MKVRWQEPVINAKHKIELSVLQKVHDPALEWKEIELDLVAPVCDEARDAYETAIGLERDASVRHFLQKRQSALVS